MKDKPAYGSPCNNCGHCCYNALCPMSVRLFPNVLPCVALLKTKDGGYVCGLIYAPTMFRSGDPAILSKAASLLIGAGVGCDARRDGEPDNIQFKKLQLDALRDRLPFRSWAMGVWGLR